MSYGQLKHWSFNTQSNAPTYHAPGTVGSNAVFNGVGTATFSAPGFDPTNAPSYDDVDGYAYTSDGWSTSGTVDVTDYLEFTVTATGDNLDFSHLEFVVKRDANGPQKIEVYTDVDGFASTIASTTLGTADTYAGVNVNLTSATFQDLASLTIRIYGFDATNSTGTITFDEMTFQTIAVLPVELAYFEAKKMEDNTLLNWATYSEFENETYVIERSANGSNFEAIDELNGAGTTIEYLSYEYQDENPMNGVNYYRLRMIDFAGESTFSPVTTIEFESLDAEIKLFPNPVVDYVSINFSQSTSASVTIYNLSGQIIRQMSTSNYDNKLIIETNDLESGQYFINIQTSNNQMITKKFIKF